MAILYENGYLYTHGFGQNGRLGRSDEETSLKPQIVQFDESITFVAVSSYHSLAVTKNNIYTWGSNLYGQLGYVSDDPNNYIC